VKKERLQRLMEVQNRISREINQTYVGTVQEVLVEGPSKTNPHRYSGRTRTNKVVTFPADPALLRQLVRVRITEAHSFSLAGDVVRE
jgi:tRNA-2-methylthio-N6-dimethylallyladenosine synthase